MKTQPGGEQENALSEARIDGLRCWHPDPAAGAPPRCWVASASTRERLGYVCAVLRRYGIAAYPALGEDPEFTRIRVRTALQAEFPHSDGSFVFWTAHDDHGSFGASGDLEGPLRVYFGGPGVEHALMECLHRVGLSSTMGPDLSSLIVPAVS